MKNFYKELYSEKDNTSGNGTQETELSFGRPHTKIK